MPEKEPPVEMSLIMEPFLSMDKITILMNTGPRFSFADPHRGDMRFENKKSGFVEQMIKDIRRSCPDSFEIKGICSKETELYHYHFRLAGGVDLQMIPKFGIRKKQKDEDYIKMLYGPEEYKAFEDDGYIYEKFDSDFCIRLEFNPQKDDFSLCAPLISHIIKNYCDPDIYFCDLFKISRLDIAVDYPEALNPCLFSSTARRGNQHFGPQGIETLYLGTRRSPFQFRIYDKKVELLKEHNINYVGSDLWRIELESRPAIEIGKDLCSYSEIFAKLDYFYGRQTGEYKFDWFLNYAKQYGIQSALKTITNVNTRQKYKQKYINLDFDSLKHPKRIVGWEFPKLWRKFYDDLKKYCGRENDPFLYPRNLKEAI